MSLLLGSTNGFELVKEDIDVTAWTQLCKQLKAPPFFDYKYLVSILSLDFSQYLLLRHKRNHRVIGVLPLVDYSDCFLAPYLGLICASPLKFSDSTRYQISFELLFNYFIDSCVNSNSFISCPPGTIDIRGVSWALEYGDHSIDYSVKPRFTSLLDINSTDLIFKNYRSVRRQEIRRFESQNTFRFSLSSQPTSCLNVYIKMFMEKSIEISAIHLNRISKYLEYGVPVYTFCILSKDDTTVAFASFISSDHTNTAYYLIGAVDPNYRKYNLMSSLLHNSFKFFSNINFKYVDLVGINSPSRGDFKSSFSGITSLYFDFHLSNY